MQQFDLIVIGGGAAGFYGAIQTAELSRGARILIIEKTNKLLSKVRVSGGGRCNVTHHCFEAIELSHHYPRGEKQLQPVFKRYQAVNVIDWFRDKGVMLKTEDDGRMFPVSDRSETIIDCFLDAAENLRIKINVEENVARIENTDGTFHVAVSGDQVYHSRNILIATGGSPKAEAYNFITALGHSIRRPIPSLFTFNDSIKDFQDLMGVSVPSAEVKIAGTKFSQTGPLLITHWGLSGPAVIKLSAWAAEYLHTQQYTFTAMVSWIGPIKEDDLRGNLQSHQQQHGKQRVVGNPLYKLPSRLWERLCERAGIEETKIWAELPLKNLNRLLENLMRCGFSIKGKTTFKEEFVTCGGVDLAEIDLTKMESKKIPGLFFAGEVLNVDGETGGFNFQAAWSTSHVAAKAISEKIK